MKILSQLSKYCCGLSIKVYNNFADKVQTRILCFFIGVTCSWWSSISSTRSAVVFFGDEVIWEGESVLFVCINCQWLVCNVFIWCQISIVGANKELDQNQWQHSQTELIKIFSSCQSQTRFYFFISAEKEKQLPIQWYKIAILCFIMNILTEHFYIVYSSAHFQMIS